MSMQQVVQPRLSANGFGRRRVERETGSRLESKFLPGKLNPSSSNNPGAHTVSKVVGYESPSRDRLIYMTTCLIGHQVEVQVKNGSVFSGIFHATNAEKDFGIILKMARLTKDGGSSRGQKLSFDSSSKSLSKTLIIPAKDLVQVIAKGVSVTGNELTNGIQHERRQDIMIDSYISQNNVVDVERELERWTPDVDDPEFPELDIFDGTWNRKWDQFETNAALFGVKSTFNEELYTTKLEKGPQMRELEREALRIAREIEGEDTQDLHLAEERGFHLHEDFDMDEESRFSAVFRGMDDSGFVEDEDNTLDSQNTETFGASSDSGRPSNVAEGRTDDGIQTSSSSSSLDGTQLSQLNAGRNLYHTVSSDHATQLDGESRKNGNLFREQHGEVNSAKELVERKTVNDEAETSKYVGGSIGFTYVESSLNVKKVGSDKGGLSPSATAYAPSSVSSKGQEHANSVGELNGARPGKAHVVSQPLNPSGRPGGSASRTSERVGAVSASSGSGLSPSSSVGSLSSEKSTLNPYAKEFKLNPNAKSFTPSQAPLRPSSPASDASYYFPANVSAVPHIPMGIGIGHTFGGPQPVIYNPQAAPIQSPQTYIHPNGPLYGQQMILGHPRQVLYMPSYPPDVQYKVRDF